MDDEDLTFEEAIEEDMYNLPPGERSKVYALLAINETLKKIGTIMRNDYVIKYGEESFTE